MVLYDWMDAFGYVLREVEEIGVHVVHVLDSCEGIYACCVSA